MSRPKAEVVKNTRNIRLELLIAAALLNIFALSFNILLTSSSLEKQYVASLISTYEVIGYDLKQNIERAVRFGKSIEKFVGLEVLLDGTLDVLNQHDLVSNTTDDGGTYPAKDRYLAVVLPDSVILYSSNRNLIGSKLPEKARIPFKDISAAKKTKKEAISIKIEESFFIILPIRDRKGSWIASAILTFNEDKVKALTGKILKEKLLFGALTILAVLFLLNMFLGFFLPQKRSGLYKRISALLPIKSSNQTTTLTKGKISALLFVTIFMCQISFSWFSMTSFKDYFLKITKEKTVILSSLLQEDIENFLNKGLKLNKLYKAEVILGDAIVSLPEVESISVLDHDSRPLYIAKQDRVINTTKDGSIKPDIKDFSPSQADYNVRININKSDEIKGYISTNISKDITWAKLKAIALDTATILIISILFSVELVIILFNFLQQKDMKTDQNQTTNYGMIRPVAFAYLFAVTLSVSFLPLHMDDIYLPIAGLSRDMVLGLPISIEILFTLLILFPCATWMNKKGWHQPFLYGALITAAGMFLSGIADRPLEFIIYRGILGIGYGLSWMSFQGFVLTYAREEERAKGLSRLVAGIFAGSICGGATGAMLADKFGFKPVFFIQAGILLLILTIIIITMRPLFSKTVPLTEMTSVTERKRNYVTFILDKNIFSTFWFSIIPTSFCVVGILYFVMPLYLHQIGVSQSDIGRVFMVYGLCMIFIAPFIGEWIDNAKNKKLFIMLGGLCGGLGLLFFAFYDGFWAAVIMIFMLGMSSSFGSSSQVVFVLNSKATDKIGYGKAISFQRSADKLGQMFGPVIFGLIIGHFGIHSGIIWVGGIFMLLTLLFIFLSKEGS